MAADKTNGVSDVTTGDVIALDRRIFILTAHIIVLVDGREFKCPPSNYGKEEKILHLLGDLIVPLLKVGFGAAELEPKQLGEMTEILLTGGPGRIAQAASILTGQDDDWVRENMEIDSILGLIIPFFVSKWNSTRAVLLPLMTSAVAAAERQQAKPRSASVRPQLS